MEVLANQTGNSPLNTEGQPLVIRGLIELKKSLIAFGIGELNIEAAHIYQDQEPNQRHFLEAKIARTIGDTIHKIQPIRIIKTAMLDDYHGSPVEFNESKYRDRLARHGWTVDEFIREAQMTPLADQILATLREKGGIDDEKNQFRGVDLRGVAPHDQYSCALLDAAATIHKLNQGAQAILNVLPATYKPQQENMRKLVRGFLPQHPECHDFVPIYNAFTLIGGDGKIEVRIGVPKSRR